MNIFKNLPGSVSSMRVAMFICMIVALGIAVAGVVMWACCDKAISDITGLVASILSSAFVGKAVQSFSENKPGGTDEKTIPQ